MSSSNLSWIERRNLKFFSRTASMHLTAPKTNALANVVLPTDPRNLSRAFAYLRKVATWSLTNGILLLSDKTLLTSPRSCSCVPAAFTAAINNFCGLSGDFFPLHPFSDLTAWETTSETVLSCVNSFASWADNCALSR